jgi:aminopeptidase N
MFPFYMGINETKYAWMDEGWATLGEWLISPMIDSTIVDDYGVEPYAHTAGTENDLPVRTPSTELSRGYFTNSYPKPAMGYLYVKDYLGDALFTKALHHYITQWQGKHPMPNDFFYSMNEGSGKNLNWFWQKWFFDDGVPDLAIRSVKKYRRNKMDIVVTSKGAKPLPVDLIIYYNDNTTGKVHRNISVWEKGNTSITLTITAFKPVAKLVLSDPHTPDSNPRDNAWEAK